jgi:hypothetical protein
MVPLPAKRPVPDVSKHKEGVVAKINTKSELYPLG